MRYARPSLATLSSCLPTARESWPVLAAASISVAGSDIISPLRSNASGGALYLRPLLLGTGPNLILNSPDEFTFVIWVSPVGSL